MLGFTFHLPTIFPTPRSGLDTASQVCQICLAIGVKRTETGQDFPGERGAALCLIAEVCPRIDVFCCATPLAVGNRGTGSGPSSCDSPGAT
jgi:hypothetical protein